MKPEKNYTIPRDRRRAGVADALLLVAEKQEGLPSAAVFEHGTLQVKMYSPREFDRQTEHARDEVYVVARGSGWFVNGGKEHPFQTGDMLFVPAGVSHRAPGEGRVVTSRPSLFIERASRSCAVLRAPAPDRPSVCFALSASD